MSFVDKKIMLTPFQHLLLAALSTAFVVPIYTNSELTVQMIDLALVEISLSYLLLGITFLTSLTLSLVFSRKISIDPIKILERWERKNHEAELILDKPIQEIISDMGPKIKLFKQVSTWLLIALLLTSYSFPITALFLDLPDQQKVIIILASFLILIPIIHIQAWLALSSTIGHKRMYHHDGKILSREALFLVSPGGFILNVNKFTDMENKEKQGRNSTIYSLKVGRGWKNMVFATSSNFDKINMLREKIQDIVANEGLDLPTS